MTLYRIICYVFILCYYSLVFIGNLTYVIPRELDLLRHPNLSIRHLAQDAVICKYLLVPHLKSQSGLFCKF